MLSFVHTSLTRHASSRSCCRPLEDIAAVGMTLSEFACLARCNGLTAIVETPRLDPESRTAGIKKFRQDLLRAAKGEVTMALSYSRKTLGQTGDGHFSCIGAYSEKDDKVEFALRVSVLASWTEASPTWRRSYVSMWQDSNTQAIGLMLSSLTTLCCPSTR